MNGFLKGLVTLFISFLILLVSDSANGQQSASEQLSLSVGASAGILPVLTFGNVEESGAGVGVRHNSEKSGKNSGDKISLFQQK